MRVMGRRCCAHGNGSSEGRGRGARMTFLQGGPKFEVTPLYITHLLTYLLTQIKQTDYKFPPELLRIERSVLDKYIAH